MAPNDRKSALRMMSRPHKHADLMIAAFAMSGVLYAVYFT